jgi:hypothetical protein
MLLQPAQIRISSRSLESVHGGVFENFFDAIKGGMKFIPGKDEKTMMIFCSDYRLLAQQHQQYLTA